MLKLSIIEILFRAIPETIIFVVGMYIFSRTKIEAKRFPLISICLFVGIIFIRSLPISYGIHTILIIILDIFLGSYLGKIEVTSVIRGAVTVTLVQAITEAINITWIQYGLGKDLELIFQDGVDKVIYGIPSLVLTGIIIGCYYIKQRKRLQK